MASPVAGFLSALSIKREQHDHFPLTSIKRKSSMSDLRHTQRGFVRGDFTDRYGQKCSIQKSSLAFSDECIWLGVDLDMNGVKTTRMHLTQEMVADLIPLLQTFVETGDLPEPRP